MLLFGGAVLLSPVIGTSLSQSSFSLLCFFFWVGVMDLEEGVDGVGLGGDGARSGGYGVGLGKRSFGEGRKRFWCSVGVGGSLGAGGFGVWEYREDEV